MESSKGFFRGSSGDYNKPISHMDAGSLDSKPGSKTWSCLKELTKIAGCGWYPKKNVPDHW